MLAEETIFCQPSWTMESSSVRLAVTHFGAHMGPVHFCKGREDVCIDPYYVSPWQCEENGVPLGYSEKILRGDFLCLPFGYAGLEYPSHGKTAGSKWSLEGYRSLNGLHELQISMRNAIGSANVSRQYFLRDGEEVVYDRTRITGLSGPHTVGHHAVLRVPTADAPLLISTSPQLFGMTYPKVFDEADGAASQSLPIGVWFSDLSRVPKAGKDGETTDIGVYPFKDASTDIVQVAGKATEEQPGWTAVVNAQEGYLWFSMRDIDVLPSTLLWMENRGRQTAPWNGRTCVLGLEDVCSFFDFGSDVSERENAFSSRGVKTVQVFEQNRPLVISYLQGATKIPPEFGRVCTVKCTAGRATFTDANGSSVRVALDSDFLFGKDL